ncbi:MAG: linear amide C-N hydrolase, partial [Verrucomicrobiota bacterium]
YEVFRILDNFNVPASAAEGTDADGDADEIRSATQFTSAFDTKNLAIYYHTMDNRRVRMIDMKSINFSKADGYAHFPLDAKPEQDIEDVTPGN